jgi:hypothetical protein
VERNLERFVNIARRAMGAGASFIGFTVYSRHSAAAVFANTARVPLLQRLAAQRANLHLPGERATYFFGHRVKRGWLSR